MALLRTEIFFFDYWRDRCVSGHYSKLSQFFPTPGSVDVRIDDITVKVLLVIKLAS